MGDAMQVRWKMVWRCLGSGAACLAVASCTGHARRASDNWARDWAPVGHAERLTDVWTTTPLRDAVQTRAGVGASDCLSHADDRTQALACVRSARDEHANAFVSFGYPGMDSMLGWGLVSLASGELELYRFDSSPCGGGDCPYRLRMTTCLHIAEPLADGDGVEHICSDPKF